MDFFLLIINYNVQLCHNFKKQAERSLAYSHVISWNILSGSCVSIGNIHMDGTYNKISILSFSTDFFHISNSMIISNPKLTKVHQFPDLCEREYGIS